MRYMEKITYCLYARKSSESDERQALSIGSQIAEMQKIADKQSLKVVETIQESKSAKDSSSGHRFRGLRKYLSRRSLLVSQQLSVVRVLLQRMRVQILQQEQYLVVFRSLCDPVSLVGVDP